MKTIARRSRNVINSSWGVGSTKSVVLLATGVIVGYLRGHEYAISRQSIIKASR